MVLHQIKHSKTWFWTLKVICIWMHLTPQEGPEGLPWPLTSDGIWTPWTFASLMGGPCHPRNHDLFSGRVAICSHQFYIVIYSPLTFTSRGLLPCHRLYATSNASRTSPHCLQTCHTNQAHQSFDEVLSAPKTLNLSAQPVWESLHTFRTSHITRAKSGLLFNAPDSTETDLHGPKTSDLPTESEVFGAKSVSLAPTGSRSGHSGTGRSSLVVHGDRRTRHGVTAQGLGVCWCAWVMGGRRDTRVSSESHWVEGSWTSQFPIHLDLTSSTLENGIWPYKNRYLYPFSEVLWDSWHNLLSSQTILSSSPM